MNTAIPFPFDLTENGVMSYLAMQGGQSTVHDITATFKAQIDILDRKCKNLGKKTILDILNQCTLTSLDGSGDLGKIVVIQKRSLPRSRSLPRGGQLSRIANRN